MFNIKYFKSLDGVYKHYGEENIVPITETKQAIFYTTIWGVQPVFVRESDRNKGKMAYFFVKDDTKECYEAWMKARPDKNR